MSSSGGGEGIGLGGVLVALWLFGAFDGCEDADPAAALEVLAKGGVTVTVTTEDEPALPITAENVDEQALAEPEPQGSIPE